MSMPAGGTDQLHPAPKLVYRHSRIVRVTHWINALCLGILLMSGLQIFNAHPALNFGNQTDFRAPFLSLGAKDNGKGSLSGTTTLFGISFTTTGLLGASRGPNGEMEERGFPSWLTIPSYQDLATGRRWHFFFAWLLVLNGGLYLLKLFAGRHLRDFVPNLSDLRSIPKSIIDHARLRFPKGNEALHYNPLGPAAVDGPAHRACSRIFAARYFAMVQAQRLNPTVRPGLLKCQRQGVCQLEAGNQRPDCQADELVPPKFARVALADANHEA